MVFSLLCFELTLNCTSDRFDKLKNKHRPSPHGSYLIDNALTDKGALVEYHDYVHKKRIKLIINTAVLFGNDDVRKLWKSTGDNVSKLLRKLEKRIDRYFDSKYTLDDFVLARADFGVNINVGDRNTVAEYIRALKNIGRAKGFKLAHDNRAPANSSYFLKGNSNGLEFTVYDLEAAAERKEAKGMLRAEVRLVKHSPIRNNTRETETSKQLKRLAADSEDIFMDTFIHVVPFGDYYKKADVVGMIRSYVPSKKTREKMLRLVELVPVKKSLHLAIKTMNDRNIDKVLQVFDTLNMSPVTLSKRQDVNYLRTLYYYLLGDK